jgi:hypothetical protein
VEGRTEVFTTPESLFIHFLIKDQLRNAAIVPEQHCMFTVKHEIDMASL